MDAVIGIINIHFLRQGEGRGNLDLEPATRRVMSPWDASTWHHIALTNSSIISKLRNFSRLRFDAVCCHLCGLSGQPVVMQGAFWSGKGFKMRIGYEKGGGVIVKSTHDIILKNQQ